jgi:hypothetical protein
MRIVLPRWTAPPVFNAIPKPDVGFAPRSCAFGAGEDAGGVTVMFTPVTPCPLAMLIGVTAPEEVGAGAGAGAGFELEAAVVGDAGELPLFSTTPPQPINNAQTNRSGLTRHM